MVITLLSIRIKDVSKEDTKQNCEVLLIPVKTFQYAGNGIG